MSVGRRIRAAHLQLRGEFGGLVLVAGVKQLLELRDRLLQVERHDGGDGARVERKVKEG